MGMGYGISRGPDRWVHSRTYSRRWGATGSTGSFLYYSQDLNLYIAGTFDSASSDMTPFILMGGALSLVSGNEHSSHGV